MRETSLFDRFAMAAMQGLLAGDAVAEDLRYFAKGRLDAEYVAEDAYRIAAAMAEVRATYSPAWFKDEAGGAEFTAEITAASEPGVSPTPANPHDPPPTR